VRRQTDAPVYRPNGEDRTEQQNGRRDQNFTENRDQGQNKEVRANI
jgi:hypothetical protein